MQHSSCEKGAAQKLGSHCGTKSGLQKLKAHCGPSTFEGQIWCHNVTPVLGPFSGSAYLLKLLLSPGHSQQSLQLSACKCSETCQGKTNSKWLSSSLPEKARRRYYSKVYTPGPRNVQDAVQPAYCHNAKATGLRAIAVYVIC